MILAASTALAAIFGVDGRDRRQDAMRNDGLSRRQI
jgi:hypothetical protein